MPHELLLGLDIGTSRIKSALIDGRGRTRTVTAVATPFASGPGGAEMSADAFLRAVGEVLIGHPAEDLARVGGVGIASMGETGTTVTRAGPGSLPLPAWYDERGSGTVAAIAASVGDNEVVRRTGRRTRTMTTVAKLGSYAEAGWDLTGTWVGVAGLVLWRLTGVVAQEPSLAATSGAYNPRTGAYDPDILAAAGLADLDWAPVHRAGTAMGQVSGSGHAWSGLPDGVPVTIAGHDHPVGVVGAGGRPDDVVDSMGTGEPLVTAWSGGSGHPRLADADGELTVTPWPGREELMVLWEGIQPGVGFRRLLDQHALPREQLETTAPHDVAPYSFADLLAIERGEVFLDPPATAWARLCEGYAETVTRAEVGLRRLTGAGGPTILIGGGARSGRWVEAKLRRAPAPVSASDEVEAVTRGAALYAGVAAGRWSLEALPPAATTPLRTGVRADG